jgi:hypothetical protein
MKFSVQGKRLEELFAMADRDHSGGIDAHEFADLMKSVQPALIDAVAYDIDEGIRVYNSVDDHETHPISILVNREAFTLLFPPGADREDPKSPNVRTKRDLSGCSVLLHC